MENNPGLTEEHEACTSSGLFSPWTTRRRRLNQTTFSLDSKDKSQGHSPLSHSSCCDSEKREKTQGVTCSHYLRSTLNHRLSALNTTHTVTVQTHEKRHVIEEGVQRKTRKHPDHAKENWTGMRKKQGGCSWPAGSSASAEKAASVTCREATKQCHPFFPQDRKTRFLLKKPKRTKGR